VERNSSQRPGPKLRRCVLQHCKIWTHTGICGHCAWRASKGGRDVAAFLRVETLYWAQWSQLYHPSTCVIEECPDCGVRDCPTADPRHHNGDGCPSCTRVIVVR
jgi:hypothetical protein